MSVNKGAVFAVFFGLIFLGVGVGAGFFSVRTLTQADAMRTWRETPATVLACDLNVSHGSKGGASYCVSARYQYEAGGVLYKGDRVSLHSGSDNMGQFHHRVYAQLKRCLDRKEPTACWVNPRSPAEAILIRKPRPEMLIFMQVFVLAFGGAGLAVVLAGLAGLLQPSAQADQSIGQGHIRMRGAASHRVAGALALAWNSYVGWFLWKVYVVTAPELIPWYLWVLAATGVVPAAVAAYLIGRFRKFGISVFEMSPLPGVLGGPVAGTVRIPAKVETEDGFDLVLQCIHQFTTGSGKNASTHRDVLWEDARHIDGSLSYGEETMLPVRFSVPYDQQGTTAPGGGNGYYWRLNATAAAPGIDYKAVFDVPVKRTPQSSATFAQLQMPASAAGQTRVEDVVARSSLRLEPQPGGGFELTFPASRARSEGLFLALFAVGWTGVCYLLWTVAKAPVFFATVFTLVDGILVMALLNVLFVSRGISVDRVSRACVVWWRFAGFPRQERRIPFDAVLDIRSERSGQSGNTMYYRVVLVTNGGSPATVGSGIKMWNDAEAVAKLLLASVKP
jgi:hypothetical protein